MEAHKKFLGANFKKRASSATRLGPPLSNGIKKLVGYIYADRDLVGGVIVLIWIFRLFKAQNRYKSAPEGPKIGFIVLYTLKST